MDEHVYIDKIDQVCDEAAFQEVQVKFRHFGRGKTNIGLLPGNCTDLRRDIGWE